MREARRAYRYSRPTSRHPGLEVRAALDLHYVPDSGFVARNGGPRRDSPSDWVVWHFTHRDNLELICGGGFLLPSSVIEPRRSVANERVKGRRTYSVVPDNEYPTSIVHDHVPFYMTAKSPMLYVVTSPGSAPFKAPSTELVFLGAVLGDLIDAGLTWCISNGNASSRYTEYTRDLDAIGDFVDFELLCARIWRDTPDDPYRQGRRAAECLVLGPVPIELISVVVTRDQPGLNYASEQFDGLPGIRQYHVMPEIFYN